ncbi:D-aminoacyl-tRNA deacylase [Rubritalea profundi]|uniref:D-aminoacyl-tRNA deacylase n=1 Tax=Rubritalea profundi TaxID=1658618 RepID=A0A2S7U340_9BACT|nr:D-aminoacyl-tRNA deacylase [Rubritalea profundi]PQJ28804.1 D-tyrosyl-tRNA(Tyr) deacylase [Rubritalea profundi]
MRVVIQRVSSASVTIEGKVSAEITNGFLILLGIEAADSAEDIDWLTGKISKMRVFADSEGLMNKSLTDIKGSALVVSQFTLHANTKKGNRPSFIRAARPEQAEPMYQTFLQQLGERIGSPCQSGEFGADMQVSLVNDGPVTIIIDSKNRE